MKTIKNAKIRRAIKIIVPLFAIPTLVLASAKATGERVALFTSCAVAALTVPLFVAGVEKAEFGTRRTVIVAILTALASFGRLIPFFKPVTAIATIAGIHLGAESGFAVGAFSALISDFYFGLGPWTPFQMLAWGVIGFFAGVLSSPLGRSRVMRTFYGVVSGVAFSLITDVWTVTWYNGTFSASLYLAATITALPHTILYAVSNLLFLALLSKPFGEKLERVKIKYGV